MKDKDAFETSVDWYEADETSLAGPSQKTSHLDLEYPDVS